MLENEEKVKVISLMDPKTHVEQKYLMPLKVLGQGKYGKVYKAIHMNRPEKVFAVKVIRIESKNPKIRQEYLQELEIIKHLPKSRHLVQIHPQHLESQNNFYIFEEFCDGGTLSDEKMRMKNVSYTEDQAFNLFYQISLGFIHLIQGKIYHQDIKPQNVLIKNGIYKLTDFGISQIAEKHQISAVRKGTLLYMPPQKLKSAKYVPTAKSEMYSLGVTLFEAIFGHHPYLTSKPADYRQYLKMLQEASPKSINSLKKIFESPSLAIDRLIRTLMKMLELSESKRLSLHELKDYITTCQPFISIVIQQSENPQQTSHIKKMNKKYKQVGQSKVIMRQSLPKQNMLDLFSQEQILYHIECYKMIFEIIKQISVFLQQGAYYARQCKIHRYSKKLASEYGDITQAEYLQFVISFINNSLFQQVTRSINDFIIKTNTDQLDQVSYENDLDYIKNQFYKVIAEITLKNKQELVQRFKEQNLALQELSDIVVEVYQETNCVRVNFKDDIFALLFSKYSGKIIKFIEQLMSILQQEKGVKSLIKSEVFEQTKQVLRKFGQIENLKKQKLLQFFRAQMIEQQKEILEDDESNSDEFEILQFDEQM